MSLGLSGLGALSIVERFLLTLTKKPGIHYEEEPVECTKLLQRRTTQVTEYFPFIEELSILDGVVFKGERIIVPSTLR